MKSSAFYVNDGSHACKHRNQNAPAIVAAKQKPTWLGYNSLQGRSFRFQIPNVIEAPALLSLHALPPLHWLESWLLPSERIQGELLHGAHTFWFKFSKPSEILHQVLTTPATMVAPGQSILSISQLQCNMCTVSGNHQWICFLDEVSMFPTGESNIFVPSKDPRSIGRCFWCSGKCCHWSTLRGPSETCTDGCGNELSIGAYFVVCSIF